MLSSPTIKLFYIHDPMCSWCYAGTQTFEQLFAQLDSSICLVRLLGGLAKDTNNPMPEETKAMVINSWKRIEKNVEGVRFNFDFWTENIPKRSTYPSCRAVIAAREQGDKFDILMTKAIQKSYYQEALNPSETDVLIEIAQNIGLNTNLFEQNLKSPKTESTLLKEIKTAQNMKVDSYPSLVLQKGETSFWPIPIDYNDANSMLETIELLLED